MGGGGGGACPPCPSLNPPLSIIKLTTLIYLYLALSFDGTTQEYLLLSLITHSKNPTLLLYLLINCMCARSAPQMPSPKDELCFLHSPVIGVCIHWLNVDPQKNICSCVSNSVSRFMVKQFADQWGKSLLTSIILLITSNSKCFIAQYFVRSCSFW